MPKEVTVVEGGPIMDPSSEQFQSMLLKAQTAAADKLAIKPDISMTEDTKDVKETPKASSAESEDHEETEDQPQSKETGDKETEELEEDVTTLKHRISGLQAELTRIRKQRTGSTEEASSLKEQIADMQGQLKVLREGKTTQ